MISLKFLPKSLFSKLFILKNSSKHTDVTDDLLIWKMSSKVKREDEIVKVIKQKTTCSRTRPTICISSFANCHSMHCIAFDLWKSSLVHQSQSYMYYIVRTVVLKVNFQSLLPQIYNLLQLLWPSWKTWHVQCRP